MELDPSKAWILLGMPFPNPLDKHTLHSTTVSDAKGAGLLDQILSQGSDGDSAVDYPIESSNRPFRTVF